jgi:tubulin epsilon
MIFLLVIRYREEISEQIRRAAEHCDCLQSFIVLHSMGGGTGSGLGTYVLGLLRDEYPEVYRFVTAVFPSVDDDVVTSPYNAMLALKQLTEHADAVLPVENQALSDICMKISEGKHKTGKYAAKQGSAVSEAGKAKLPWDQMNNIVAHMYVCPQHVY